ncbi:MAG: hypothetical protein J3K34DRAFT_525428 [Monoraphidium minutum]|nr:MAG: hypothetical protein J3K34DRAFT_525428 [Monoraphidium minutum]
MASRQHAPPGGLAPPGPLLRVGLAALLTLLATAALPRPTDAGDAKPVLFSSSVILFNVKDMSYIWRQDARVSSWCAQIGNNAHKQGSDQISVVLTQNWMPVISTYECPKPNDCRPKYDHYTIKHYCYRDVTGSECKPFTWDVAADFQQKLTSCLGTLVEQGFKQIMITPHLDNAIDNNQWRNWLRMNPTEKIDGFSFWDIQLSPIANAVNANLQRGVTFLVNLQGEMGTSMFGWPQEYSRLKGMVKKAAIEGKQDLHARVKIGFKINFEKVAGYADQVNGGINGDEVRKLFKMAEYIALSAYAPVDASGFGPNDLQRSAQIADEELRQWGVESLKKRKLYYGEFGVGGGTSPYCDKLAKSSHEAAATPQYGTCWQYQPKMDPWSNSNAVRDFMRRYYDAALDWLAKGTGPTYYISGVFAWNLVSWDVQGIHPLSYDGNGESFKDQVVAADIIDHNKKVAGKRRRA